MLYTILRCSLPCLQWFRVYLNSAICLSHMKYCFTLMLALPGSRLLAAEYSLKSDDGLAFFQLDFPDEVPPRLDSRSGMVEIQLTRLREHSQLDSGYLNISIEGRWLIRNVEIASASESSKTHQVVQFMFDIEPGVDVRTINAAVLYTEYSMPLPPVNTNTQFQVDSYTSPF